MALGLALCTAATAQDLETGDQIRPGDGERIEACFRKIEASWDGNPDLHLTYYNCIGTVSEACQQESMANQSTQGMSNCAYRETLWWDRKLNDYYKTLQQNLEPAQFELLRDAQRKWIDWRDASCGFEYGFWEEGTIRSIFYSSCQLQMTAQRMIDLQTILGWLDIGTN